MKTPVLYVAAAFGALCFLPGTMSAPSNGPAAPRPSSLREYLNLSDAQAQALDRLQAQRNGKARESIQNLNRKRTALRTRLASSNAGVLSVGAAVLQLELAKTQAGLTSSELTEEARAYLTPVQLAKLQELERIRQLQPLIREAGAKFLIAPPDAVVKGTGPLGMFAPARPPRSPAPAAVSLPDTAEHTEDNQVVKLAME